jgi:hypothetical protein
VLGAVNCLWSLDLYACLCAAASIAGVRCVFAFFSGAGCRGVLKGSSVRASYATSLLEIGASTFVQVSVS